MENPDRGFAPSPGVLTEFVPAGGAFVRVDTHGYPGYKVPADYDSLLAKLVVWAPDREQALARMKRALEEFRIEGPGVHTTSGFLAELISDPVFAGGRHTTSIVADVLAAREAGEQATGRGNTVELDAHRRRRTVATPLRLAG